MNTVLLMVMLILVIFALKEGMVWVALGVGLVMVLVTAGEGNDSSGKAKQKMLYSSPELPPPSDMKEQMLRVKYQPKWDGNNWWEEMADHWGTSIGRAIGLWR